MSRVHGHVLLRQAVFSLRHRGPGEHGLIDVYDALLVPLCPLELPLHLGRLLCNLLWIMVLLLLRPNDPPLIDAVRLVDLAEQSWVHMAAWELL